MRATRISVTNLSNFECPRHNVLGIMGAIRGLSRPFSFNKYTLAGNLLHIILQETMLRKFSHVQYFHQRQGFTIEQSLFLAMNRIMEKWQSLLFSKEYSHADSPELVEAALELVEKKLANLAHVSCSLVHNMGDSITTSSVADEFTVLTLVGGKLLLVGHVDLAALEKNRLRLIELKTGNRYKSDKTQIQLYGEILSCKHPREEATLELWYCKTGNIVPVMKSETNLLKQIEEAASIAFTAMNAASLPPPLEKRRCGFCTLCDSIHLLFGES